MHGDSNFGGSGSPSNSDTTGGFGGDSGSDGMGFATGTDTLDTGVGPFFSDAGPSPDEPFLSDIVMNNHGKGGGGGGGTDTVIGMPGGSGGGGDQTAAPDSAGSASPGDPGTGSASAGGDGASPGNSESEDLPQAYSQPPSVFAAGGGDTDPGGSTDSGTSQDQGTTASGGDVPNVNMETELTGYSQDEDTGNESYHFTQVPDTDSDATKPGTPGHGSGEVNMEAELTEYSKDTNTGAESYHFTQVSPSSNNASETVDPATEQTGPPPSASGDSQAGDEGAQTAETGTAAGAGTSPASGESGQTAGEAGGTTDPWMTEMVDQLTREGADASHASAGGSPEGQPDGTGDHGEPTGDDKSLMEIIHNALEILGLYPALGVVPDAVNTGLYLIEGNWKEAGISATAMVPLLGQGATLTKQGVALSRETAEALGEKGIQNAVRQASVRGSRQVPGPRSEKALRAAARSKAARVIREGMDRNGGEHPLKQLLSADRKGLVRRTSRSHSHLADNVYPDAVHGDSKFTGALDRLGIGDAHINQALQGQAERKGTAFSRQFLDIGGVPVDEQSANLLHRMGWLKDADWKKATPHPGWFPDDL